MAHSLVFILLIIIVVCILILQYHSFSQTGKNINQLNSFFPEIDKLSVKNFRLNAELLSDNKKLATFLENPDGSIDEDALQEAEDDTKYVNVSLICVSNSVHDNTDKYAPFLDIIRKTNTYLCKNVGTSADFSLIKDICERSLDIKEEEIQNSLNAPLYMGLGGTFLGIITGVFGVEINKLQAGDLDSVSSLLQGVGIAMIASFIGLIFTVINSTFKYKGASANADTNKDDYFNFIQRELMPTLSTSVASSLNALKNVLGNFTNSFGGNLSQYAQSIGVLNENIKNEKEVLEEINKLNLTSTATKMAKTFDSLKNSADALDVFKSYEQSLANAMNNTAETLDKMNESVNEFKKVKDEFRDFSEALKIAVQNQDKATQLQMQFKNAIEKNFPSGSIGREIWGKEYDELFKASKKMSDNLSQQLQLSTLHIKNFVESNNDFFSSIFQITNLMNELTQYANLQSSCYNDLKKEITDMRRDNKSLQAENAALNKSILEAIQLMTSTIKSLKI